LENTNAHGAEQVAVRVCTKAILRLKTRRLENQMHVSRHHAALKNARRILFAAGFLIALLLRPAFAQQQKPTPTPTPAKSPPPASQTPQKSETIDDEEVVRVTSNLVVVPVSVTNANGDPVQGLKLEDFRLEEDGRAQQIAAVGDPDQVALEIVLLLDVSASVDARFAFEKDAAARFLKTVLKSGDNATVYAIDSTPRLVQTRTSADDATKKLLTIEPARSKTAFYDTVVDAARYLASKTPAQHRRVIVAISDGEDTFSERFLTAAAALPEIQRADTVFYSINPSGPSYHLNKISVRAQESMEQMATATGGSAFVTETVEDTELAFRRIANELRAQYLLQYYSMSDAPNGKYLSIKVSVPKRTDVRVRARQGYYVKKK
jgi:Ca-activated chloride channel family protein